MSEQNELIPSEQIVENRILLIRGQKVLLAPDLAALYGVNSKRLHEQVRRNRNRFPEDFMFQLTKEERDELASNCGQFKNLKHSSVLPYAFTEHGAGHPPAYDSRSRQESKDRVHIHLIEHPIAGVSGFCTGPLARRSSRAFFRSWDLTAFGF